MRVLGTAGSACVCTPGERGSEFISVTPLTSLGLRVPGVHAQGTLPLSRGQGLATPVLCEHA